METMKITTAAAAAGKPGYKLTKLGWIPEEWDITTLADIVDSERNITYGIVQAGPHVEGGVPYIKTGDLSTEIKPEALSRTSHEIAQQYSRSEVYPGDIVFSLRGDVGASRIVPIDLPVANLTQGTARIAVPGESDRDFVFQQIVSPDVAKRLLDQAKGSTFQEITLKALRLFYVVWPPERERAAIAEILTSFDKGTRNLSELLIAKRTYKRGLMQQLLTGQRRFPEFQGQPWREVKLGEVFGKKSMKNVGNRVSLVITVGKYAIRPQLSHFTRSVASSDLSAYNVIEPGDFVYDPMSAYYGAIGRYDLAEAGVVSPVYRVLTLQSGFDSDFVKQLLKSSYILGRLDNASTQGNKEGKRRGLQDGAFNGVSFQCPPLPEQQRIAAVLTACDQEIELLQAQLRQWQQQKKGLMQQLLTGQLRVQH